MFLSRTEGMLGNTPVQYRSGSAKKRRYRQNSLSQKEEDCFFGTATYSNESPDQAREHEVARLFSRMREELVLIARGFAEEADESNSQDASVRQGILVEMIVASEFLLDEVDSDVAMLCQAGMKAQSEKAMDRLDEICKAANVFSILRTRITEFQRELDSMVEVTLMTFRRYSLTASLEFDPFADQGQGTHAYLEKFMRSVDQTISILALLSFTALQNRDFATVAELCSCNVQLSNFLSDMRRICTL